MKIIDFVNINGRTEMVLGADSAMLVGRKPYFVPDESEDVRGYRCVLLRICRLGKSIAPRFACRYYDAVAPGMHFVCQDLLDEAIAEGRSWTAAIAGDGSQAIGDWISLSEQPEAGAELLQNLVISPEEAIRQASTLMTLRQGDLICIHTTDAPTPAIRGEQTYIGNNIR